MKLYATITSERATKGQGGNDKLVINIKVGNQSRREIANIVLHTTGGSLTDDDIAQGKYALEYYPVGGHNGGRVLLDKGMIETKYCKHEWHKETMICKHCNINYHEEKGEKEKGERISIGMGRTIPKS